MATGTKQCPFCAEDIRVAAKKCKHCGEMLEPFAKPPPLPVVPSPSAPAKPPQIGVAWKAIQALGVFGVIVAAVAFFLSFYPDKVTFAKDWKYPGAWGIMVALAVWGMGRAGAWWFHG
jgi:hypothetical protein